MRKLVFSLSFCAIFSTAAEAATCTQQHDQMFAACRKAYPEDVRDVCGRNAARQLQLCMTNGCWKQTGRVKFQGCGFTKK
jgi:hypothetical protein